MAPLFQSSGQSNIPQADHGDLPQSALAHAQPGAPLRRDSNPRSPNTSLVAAARQKTENRI
jgi:hypothetical protein